MHNLYIKIMKALAIPMKEIVPYSMKYWEILIIVLVVALAFAFLFAKTRVSRSGVITVFGVLLLLLEIMKQCLLTYVSGHYIWSDFPWQLCSIPMYLSIFYPVFRKQKETIEVYLMCFGFIGSVAAFAMPKCSLYPYLLLTIQGIAWHGILFMISIYLMMSVSKSRSVRVFRGTAILYVITALIAILINFLTKGVSAGATNMFFLGPNYPHVIILNAIYSSYGWIMESVLMILATLAAGFVVYFVSGVGKRR